MIQESQYGIDEFFDKEFRHILCKEYVDPYVLDLHGFRYKDGEEVAYEFVRMHQNSPVRQLTIITGRSGSMYKNFPMWFVKNFSNTQDITRLFPDIIRW